MRRFMGIFYGSVSRLCFHAVGILQMALKSPAARSRSSKVGVHVQYIGCSTFQMALLDSRTVFYVISVFRCGRTVVLAFLGVHKQCRFWLLTNPLIIYSLMMEPTSRPETSVKNQKGLCINTQKIQHNNVYWILNYFQLEISRPKTQMIPHWQHT